MFIVRSFKAMFDRLQLEKLLSLHNRSYSLFLWLNDQMRNDKIHPGNVHGGMSLPDATKHWITRYRANLPADLKPDEDELQEFSSLFASYLQTSFEIVTRTVSWGMPCDCMLCLYLRRATFLKPRHITQQAWELAGRLKLSCLEKLAAELELPFIASDLELFLKKSLDLSYEISLVTYVQELFRRAKFASQGTAVLVLWRQIAWQGGKPKKNFALTTYMVLEAEKKIVERISKYETG